MELYLAMSQQIMAKALVEGEQPPSVRWRFEIDSGDSDSNRVISFEWSREAGGYGGSNVSFSF